MRLGISSAAAPDLSLDDLREACIRRGLESLEIVLDGPGLQSDHAALRLDPSLVVGLFREDPSVMTFRAAAQMAEAAGVPLVVPASRLVREQFVSNLPVAKLVLLHEERTGRVEGLIGLIEEVRASGRDAQLGLQVDPRNDPPNRVQALLDRLGDSIRYVRLLGGGPESIAQTGQGIGNLVGRLALLGFDGPLILTPSDPTRLRVWAHWLGRRAGWGCGSKGAEPSLVTFTGRSA